MSTSSGSSMVTGGGLVGVWVCRGERGENGGLPKSNGGGSGLAKLVAALILGYH
jgi:hypothetical protein